MRFHLPLALSALGALTFTACKDDDKKGNSANLPALSPPVVAATPGSLRVRSALNATTSGFADRFFNSEGGPSNIFTLLAAIDARIADINSLTAKDVKDCVSQEPASYTIRPFGQDITFYGQCYQILPRGPVQVTEGLVQFGVKDGVTYIYTSIGAGQMAAKATPIAGQEGKYTVEAWLTVNSGVNTAGALSGSYGVMELKANSAAATLEFGVAGVGLGYCGAQLKSDGTKVYAKVSTDMNTTCNAVDDLCVLASDATTGTTCSAPLSSFELPPIGRIASTGLNTFGASQYPDAPTIVLDGTATDDAHFGPTAPSAGLGSL